MARSLEFEDESGERSVVARWILPAVIVSLALHALLYVWAAGLPIHGMSTSYYDSIVPRTFRLERVEIDPKLLEPEPAVETSVAMAPKPVDLPQETVSFERLMGDPSDSVAAPPIEQPLLTDKPTLPATDLASTLEAARVSGAESLLEDAAALRETLLQDRPVAGPTAMAEAFAPEAFTGSALAPPGALQGSDQPGFSNLDDLLARTGPLSPETAPILMPTDLLFDYDSADLRPAAVDSLAKLGTLIRRNPQATFLIEGHTDAIGSDEYNLDLSIRRAQSVKNWLLFEMQIPPQRIQTRGLGKSRLIAPATGTIEEQQINRRVEIVIRGPGE